jgi:hypothetical protein
LSDEGKNVRVALALPGVAVGLSGRRGVPGITPRLDDTTVPNAVIADTVQSYLCPLDIEVTVIGLEAPSADLSVATSVSMHSALYIETGKAPALGIGGLKIAVALPLPGLRRNRSGGFGNNPGLTDTGADALLLALAPTAVNVQV